MSKLLNFAVAALSVLPTGSWADHLFDEITAYNLVAMVFSGECETRCETEDFKARRINGLSYVATPFYSNSTQVDFFEIMASGSQCDSTDCAWAIIAVGTDRAWYSTEGYGQFVAEYSMVIGLTPETEFFLPNYLGTRPQIHTGLTHGPLRTPEPSAIKDEAIAMTNSISGPLYVRILQSFDLGKGGSTREVSSRPDWKMLQTLYQQGNAARNIFQEEALRIAREAEERGTARCNRIRASGGGFCMQLTNTANQGGWHAVFYLIANEDIVDEEDAHFGDARYNFGPIDTVRVLSTRLSTDDRCDIWVTYRVWPVQEEMTIAGTAFMQANRTDSIDQEVCYRLGRNGLNAEFTNMVVE